MDYNFMQPGQARKEYLTALRRSVLLAIDKKREVGLDIAPLHTMARKVCLVGSTRFYDDWQIAKWNETMAGRIVLDVAFFPFVGGSEHGQSVGITPPQKIMLDQLHMEKVALADEIYVINRDGYIGESTRREMLLAILLNKPFRFLEPQSAEHIMYSLVDFVDSSGMCVTPIATRFYKSSNSEKCAIIMATPVQSDVKMVEDIVTELIAKNKEKTRQRIMQEIAIRELAEKADDLERRQAEEEAIRAAVRDGAVVMRMPAEEIEKPKRPATTEE
jgi:hypothetical protein